MHDLNTGLPESFGRRWQYPRPLEAHDGVVVLTGLAEPPSLPHRLAEASEWSEHERWFADIPTMLVLTARPA